MQRSAVRILALLAGLTLMVSACGGGGGSDESAEGGSSSEQSTSSGQSDGSGSSGTAEIEFGGEFDGSVEACGQLSGAFASLMLGPSMALIGGTEDLAEMRQQLSGQTFRVPAELEEPFQIIDDAYAQIERDLEGLNLTDAMGDPEAMARLDEATSAYNTPEVQGALEEVGAFLEANCTDFDLGDF